MLSIISFFYFLMWNICNTYWPWQSLWWVGFYQREWKLLVWKGNNPGGKTDMQVNYYAMRLTPELHEVFTEPKRAEQVHHHWTRNSDPEIEMCLIPHMLSVGWAISSRLCIHIPPLFGYVEVCLQGSEPVHCALSVHWPKHRLRAEEINAKN